MQYDQTILDQNCLFTFTVNLTPAATAAALAAEQAFTLASNLPKLKATDHVQVTGPGSGNAVALVGARINATGQLVLVLMNPTAGALTHAAGNFIVKIVR